MAVVFQSVGTADSGRTSGNSLTVTTEVMIPKGSTITFRHGHDNNSNSTTGSPLISTITCSVAGAFTGLARAVSRGSGSASGAGVVIDVWRATAAVDIPAGSTITATLSASVAARVFAVNYVGGSTFVSAVSAGATSGNQSITINATDATQIVQATVVREDNEATVFGTVAGWEPGAFEGTRGGSRASNVAMTSARKYPVGSVGAHTYNPSGTASGGDWVASGLLFNDTSPAVSAVGPANPVMSTNMVLTITGTNFYNVTNVTLGGENAKSFSVTSTTSITATFDTSGFSGNITSLVVYANGAYSDGDTVIMAFEPPQPPNPITDFRVVRDHYYQREILLSWTSPGSTVNIEISRNGVPIATLTPGITKYRDTGLVLDNSYTYSIRAYNELGTQTATLPPHLLTTRIPSFGYSMTYLRAASTSHSIPMPPESALAPYDIILVTVQRAGTGALSAPSNWALWPDQMNASTSSAGNIWYHRVQPMGVDPTRPTIPTLTISSGTSVELAVAVSVVKDVEVYTNEVNFKEPYIPYLGVGSTGDAANAVKSYPTIAGMSGSGLMVHCVGVTTTTSVSNFQFTNLDAGNIITSPETTGRNFIRLNHRANTVIGTPHDFKYSVNAAASHVQNALWFPEAATTKFPFIASSGITQNATSSYDFHIGTGTPATGDLVIVAITLPSGTGAVGATLVNNVGFTAPNKFYDSLDTNPGVRLVLFSSYGTAATNSAPLTFRLSYPTSVITFWGAYVKGAGNVVPTIVSKSSIGPDSMQIPLSAPALLMGIVGTYGETVANSGYYIPASEGWSNADAYNGELNIMSSARTNTGGTTPLGCYVQIGEAHTAANATWTTDLPPTYDSPVIRTLVAIPSNSARFGASTVDAIIAPIQVQFAAFGVPL